MALNRFRRSRKSTDEELHKGKVDVVETFLALRRSLNDAPKSSWVPVVCLSIFVIVSFIGTYTGMLRILESGDNSFGIWGKIGIFLFIAATTILMAYTVNQIFMRGFGFLKRFSLLLTYLITVLISMSFGFAFYWSQLEARSQATKDAELYLRAFNWELRQADEQLTSTRDTLLNLQQDFTERAAQERLIGNQCGEASGGGDGPRARHLQSRAQSIEAIVQNLTPRIERVRQQSVAVLDDIDKVSALGDKTADETTPAEREAVFRDAALSADAAGVTITALANSQSVKDNIENFKLWSNEYNNRNFIRQEGGSTISFKCYNPVIGAQLAGVATDLENLPKFTITELNTYAGAEATREALDRFWYTLVTPIRNVGKDASEQTQDQREEAIKRSTMARILGQEQANTDESESISSSQLKQTVNARQGLRRSDALPMGIAFVVDFLLLLSAAWSKPVQKFEAFRRMISEFEKMENSPLEMIANSRELSSDPDFTFLRKYLFTYNNEDHIAVPVGSAAQNVDSVLMSTMMISWQQGDIAVRVPIGDKTIRKHLIRKGGPLNNELDMTTAQFEAFRFKNDGFKNMITKGLVDISNLREQQENGSEFDNQSTEDPTQSGDRAETDSSKDSPQSGADEVS